MDKELDLIATGSWAIFDHLFEVERIPEKGETVHILTSVFEVGEIYWGGCSYNAALAAAKLGMRTGLLTVEGLDFETSGYKSYLKQYDIDLSGITILDSERSGHGFLFADPAGNSVKIGNLGAAFSQSDCRPNEEIIKSARAIIAAPMFDDFTLTACRIGQKNGLLVAVNGTLSSWPTYAASFVQTADIIFSNGFEIRNLVELLGLKDKNDLFNFGLQAIYITQGKEGCQLLLPEGESHLPAVNVERLVDPTGAGDAFVGATITGILLSYDFEIAGKIGATVASFVVEKKGSQTNFPLWRAMNERYAAFFGETLQSP